MRRSFLVCAVVLGGCGGAAAGIRAPSCDALAAFAFGARVDPIEVSFGKPPETMTVDEFDQALDVVAVCIDAIESAPPDPPRVSDRERKRTKINSLTTMAEDLKIYRERRREFERRAAEHRR